MEQDNKTWLKVVALHTRLSHLLNNIPMSALAISSGCSQESQQRSGNNTKSRIPEHPSFSDNLVQGSRTKLFGLVFITVHFGLSNYLLMRRPSGLGVIMTAGDIVIPP